MRNTLCVILHYGDENDTNRCLKSLQMEDDLDIVISDNDPLQSYSLPPEFANNVNIIRTGGSAGFSEGNNMAVKSFLSDNHDYIFILNNDTIVQNGAIKLLKDCMEDESVGAVGPCMPFADVPDEIWACGGYINKRTLDIGGLQPKSTKPYEVQYLPGAAILTRAELWKKIGGFSEKYFLAYEEAEYALELTRLGYKVVVQPKAIIVHKVGMSSQRKPQYFYNSIRNRIIFSKFLYGKSFGFIYGMIITMKSIKSKSFSLFIQRSRLWMHAVLDELRKYPISKELLSTIALRHSNKNSSS